MSPVRLITVDELCGECQIEITLLDKLIEEEWIKPLNMEEMHFDEEDLARILLINELQEDFGVNDEGIPIILSLIDQIHSLRARLK